MRHPVTHEDLMRFLDGELPSARRTEIADHLDGCTECRREVGVFEDLRSELRQAAASGPRAGRTWGGVRRRLGRSLGWALFLAGLVVWLGYALYVYFVSPTAMWVKLANGAIFIGLAVLLGSVLREHYVAWTIDPYRDVDR